MSAPRFLMCPPSYFGVQYVINPWMEGQLHHTDGTLATTQWTRLQQLIARNGEVLLMPPVDQLPDLVFTANAALIYGKKAVLSSFRCQERRPEEQHFKTWLEAQGFEIITMPPGTFFEGAGDALLDRKQPLLWFGFGFRSDLAAAELVGQALQIEVQPLRLCDPRFYHLDTCFCPLANGYLLYFEGAFDNAGRSAIESRVPRDKRLAIPESDAIQFACNAVNVGSHVIMNGAGQGTVEWLRERGFAVDLTGLGEFMKAGGAAKCLSLRLDESLTVTNGKEQG